MKVRFQHICQYHAPALAGACLLALAGLAQAQNLTNLWEVKAPDADGNLGTGGLARGLTYNAVSNEVILATREGGNKAVVYDGDTGTLKGYMSMSGIGGGSVFTWNQVACAEDGVLYGFNGSVVTFKIYRWESTDTTLAPTVAYGPGDPGNGVATNRWGDAVAIRGKGVGTEILVGTLSYNSQFPTLNNLVTNVALFTTTDGFTFTNTPIHIPGGVFAANTRIEVAFHTNNTFWVKQPGQRLQLVQYNLGTPGVPLVGSVVASYANADVPLSVIGGSPAIGKLAGVSPTSPGQLRLYDVANPLGTPTLLTSTNFQAANANGNGTGGVVFGGPGRTNRLYALWSNNGIKAAQIIWAAPSAPPVIGAGPAALTVYTNFPGVTFTVTLNAGSPPLRYQWQVNSNNIANATNSSLTVNGPFTLASSADYRVIVTNAAGSATSANARLNVIEPNQSGSLTRLWAVPNGTRPYLANDNAARGLACDPISGNLAVVSRTGNTNAVYVLDGATGADKFQLDSTSIISGSGNGTFGLNMIGVADDGYAYACNLTQNPADGNLRIYTWAAVAEFYGWYFAYDDKPTPNDPIRWGDSLAVRGAGNDTQLLLGSGNGRVVCLLTNYYSSWTALVLSAPTNVPTGFAQLGIAFGEGNTFYAKSAGYKLRWFSFDPQTSTNCTLLAEYDLPVTLPPATAIGVDSTNRLLAAVEVGNPDNLQLYRLSNGTQPPTLVDQDFFPTDNANGNATGAVAMWGDRVYALDSNNGILAMQRNLNAIPFRITSLERGAGAKLVLTWESSPGVRYNVLYKDSLSAPTWGTNAGSPVTATGFSTSLTNNLPAGGDRFYRVQAF